MANIDTPYRASDTYELYYEDGEYSLERSEKVFANTASIAHTVLEGETLQSISYQYYGDSGRWGDIATFNGIINPLDLEAGLVIQIPDTNGS